jgi:hypothetical protein
MYCTPGPDNSNLINTENAVPINPENNANIKYNVPISFALDDKNHLSCHSVGFLNVKTELAFSVVCKTSSFCIGEVEKPLICLFILLIPADKA